MGQRGSKLHYSQDSRGGWRCELKASTAQGCTEGVLLHPPLCSGYHEILHHLSYHMPAKRCVVAARVANWQDNNAFWSGNAYSLWKLPPNLTVDCINGAWCWGSNSVKQLLAPCTTDHCPCKQESQDNVCVCNTSMMVYAAAQVTIFWADPAGWVYCLPLYQESTVKGSTDLGDAQSGAGTGRESVAYPLIRLGNRGSLLCWSRAGLWLGALPEANRPGEREQDVPALSLYYRKAPIGVGHALSCLTIQLTRILALGT